MRQITPLEEIQYKIDRCNQKLGCNQRCNKQDQSACLLRKQYRARMDYCQQHGIPVYRW